MSARPAATWRIGADGSDGTRGSTRLWMFAEPGARRRRP